MYNYSAQCSDSKIALQFSPLAQVIQHQLETARTLLEKVNYQSAETASLSLTGSSEDPSIGAPNRDPKLLLLIEYSLFDLSSLHLCCRQLLSNVFRALTERDREVRGLHKVMNLLSHCLEEARTLLGRKQTVLDVGQFLSDCKVHLYA